MWTLIIGLAWIVNGEPNFDTATLGIYPTYEECAAKLVERAQREATRPMLTLPRDDYRVLELQLVCVASEESET